ncbi:MAG: ubiquitin-like protein Pup [bacterium]|nr:ubiquitin-like protein Pup [bacterium]
MAEFEQKTKGKSRREQEEDVAEDAGAAAVSESGVKLKAELDELLDEIDEVLEVNAEDFVKSYVQKGGE